MEEEPSSDWNPSLKGKQPKASRHPTRNGKRENRHCSILALGALSFYLFVDGNSYFSVLFSFSVLRVCVCVCVRVWVCVCTCLRASVHARLCVCVCLPCKTTHRHTIQIVTCTPLRAQCDILKVKVVDGKVHVGGFLLHPHSIADKPAAAAKAITDGMVWLWKSSQN